MMTHYLVGGHSTKGLELFDHEGILHSRQCKASVVPNAGGPLASLLLPLIHQARLIHAWSNFFHQGSRGSSPRHFRDEVAGVTRVFFSTTRITLFLRLERVSFFFFLILVDISWLNFVVISAEGKHLLKKKEENPSQQRTK